MKTTQVTDEIIQITRFGFVNAFLVKEDDGFTLVDTMILGSAKGIHEASIAMGLPIRRILITHAHGDHVGSVDALKQLLPGAELIISERDARLVSGDKSLDYKEPQSTLRGSYQLLKSKIDRVVNADDKVGSLIVVSTPGHTPGHVSFMDKRSNTIIAGDAFTSLFGLAPCSTMKQTFPIAALATWDRGLARKSAQKLTDLAPTILVVGHGKPVYDAAQKMRQVMR